MAAPGPLFKHIPRDPGDRDFARYRAARKQWAAEVLDRECAPEQWAEFKRQLQALGATLMPTDFLVWLTGSWLLAAHPDVKAIALREIAHRCDAIRAAKGDEPLSDPLPTEPPSLFIRCRDLLGVR